jgi:hypothetical protein
MYKILKKEKTMDQFENKFWIVVNEDFDNSVWNTGRIPRKFTMLASAQEEAKLLAKKNNARFFVFESVSAYEIDNLVEIEFTDDVPF